MGLILNTNIPALQGLASLNQTYQAIAKINHQMSTGKKVNTAADDPAGVSLISKFTSRINGMKVAQNNVGNAMDMLNIADGGLKGVSETLQDIRSLVAQARSNTLSTAERDAIQSNVNDLIGQIDDYVGQSTYNGIGLIDGTLDADIHSGPDAGDITNVSLTQDNSSTGLGIATADVSTADNASTALTNIDAAIATVDGSRTTLGGVYNAFKAKSNFLDTTITNLSASRSRIEDLDFAEAQSQMLKLQTQLQANMVALSNAIQLPTNILSLLQ